MRKSTGFFQTLQMLWRHDKQYESDAQMLTRVAVKFSVLLVIILMSDQLLDWLIEISHNIFELLHLGIEVIELSLELVLEHALHTNHHQSELILFNLAIILVLYLLCRLYFKVPQIYTRFKRNRSAGWLKFKRRETTYWRSLPLNRKIKLISAYTVGIVCILFFLTL